MIKRVYLLLTFILLLTSFHKAEAQHEIRIQGVVRDVTTNSPIGGVSIIHNGGQVAFTDVDGKYSAFVPSNAELLFYKPEYNDYVTNVENRQILNINMTIKIVELGEAIVVGKMSKKTIVVDQTELEAISRGGYIMGHPLGAKGNAGIFGGVTESLRKKGIPPVVTTDGPSGIRLYDSCSLLPIGTALACSFDTELAEELYRAVGLEMKDKGSDVLLAPGMNIHRNPLCGRNFEYFSEDPLLTGKMAAAIVRGVQSTGLSACPKHFACNNQETNRLRNDSILSERALREIYLKGFRICVTESSPKNIMTSYNKINGVWGHYHFDLTQTILRKEWGYPGNIMTDWWMRYAPSPEFPKLKGNGYRVRAGVNVLMPGSRSFTDLRRKPDGTLLSTYKKPEGITLGEMQRNAGYVLQCVMDLKEL